MIDVIKKEIIGILDDNTFELDNNTPLIGDSSPLDSMNIVNLCLRLEEVAENMGFQFDWSGETMSKSKSMFKSVADLATEFERQKNTK